jgi:tight adherence protein B
VPTFVWVGGLSALVLLALGLYVTLKSQRSLIDERLDQYLDAPQGPKEEEEVPLELNKPGVLTEWLTRRVERTSYGDRIAQDLARADLKLKTGEYFALMFLAAVLFGVFGYFFGAGSPIFAILGGLFGTWVPGFYVRRQQRARLQKFNDQLPDMLNLMVNGLRTGFSAMQAMEAVGKEMPAPMNDEFRRVVQEMQLGVPMEAALANLLRRIPSDDLDLAVTAINIQREVGGNLAEILDTISVTIRERIRIKGEVRAITAQVTLSGRFLGMMPIFLALGLWGLNRDYMEQFFSEPIICGIIMISTASLMLIFGFITLNKIADIEI